MIDFVLKRYYYILKTKKTFLKQNASSLLSLNACRLTDSQCDTELIHLEKSPNLKRYRRPFSWDTSRNRLLRAALNKEKEHQEEREAAARFK